MILRSPGRKITISITTGVRTVLRIWRAARLPRSEWAADRFPALPEERGLHLKSGISAPLQC